MEQRNGRIDRIGQPELEVRCHYFFYPRRAEDIVLARLIHKVETIQEELGSLGSVVMDRLAEVMEGGIGETTPVDLEAAEAGSDVRATVRDELESQRELRKLQGDRDENAKVADRSRRLLDFDPALLRSVIDVGLALAGAGPLTPAADAPEKDAWTLPALGDSWQRTLDILRRARRRDEGFWEWRDAAPPLPVLFRPPAKMSDEVAQLHLAHPFVQRILGRFLAQGFSAQDLSRVTALRNPHDDEVIAIAVGRLSLFGPGATRLHDQLIPVAARWLEHGGAGHRKPLSDKHEARALETLARLLRELDGDAKPLAKKLQARLWAAAPEDFADLWPHIQEEADSNAHQAAQKLEARALIESAALKKLLEEQRVAIHKELGRRRQLTLEFSDGEREQREQFERDVAHMEQRLAAIGGELETEPAQIRSLYEVALRRLEPVGLVYLWPDTRG